MLASSWATVTIRVLEAYPELVADEILEFGDVYVGSSAERVLHIANKGGAPYRGALELPDGFSAVGLAEGAILELAAQATARVVLLFKPGKEGRVQHRLRFPTEKGTEGETLLYGTGVAPFLCAPSLLRLEWDPAAAVRAASLVLTNSMEIPVVISVTAPQQLELRPTLALAPRQSRTVNIKVPLKAHSGPILGEVRLAFQGFEQTLALEANAVPAYLEVVGGPPANRAIEFHDGDRSEPVKLALVNSGTGRGTLFADIHHEFLAEGMAEGQEIAPGELLEVTLRPAHNIRAEGSFVIKCGEQKLEYTLLSEPAAADAAGSTGAAVDIDTSTALLSTNSGAVANRSGTLSPYLDQRLKMSGDELAMENFTIKVEGDYRFDHSLPKVEAMTFENGGRRFLEFSWDALAPGDYDYKLHLQTIHIDKDTGRMHKVWSLARNARVTQDGQRVLARVDALNPAMAYHFRVAALTPDGRTSLSEPFRFLTAVPRPLRYVIINWSVILLVLTSTGLLIARRVRARRFYQRYY